MKIYKHEPKHDGKGQLNPYIWDILPLQDIDLDYFAERFGLEGNVASKYIKRTPWGCYLLPILKPNGTTVGHVMRQPWGGEPVSPRNPGSDGPKSVTYTHAAYPFMSYYPVRHGCTTTVIVEDQLSAIKCAQVGIPAWALLGTHMDHNKVREIASLVPKEVLFALDPDATANAFTMARDWGLAFNKCRVALLQRDLKDTPVSDIPSTLGVVLT